MPPDDGQPLPYAGPFVTLRHAGLHYSVAVEPVLPSGEGEPRTFGSRIEAWGELLWLARCNRLPVRDYTDGNVATKLVEK